MSDKTFIRIGSFRDIPRHRGMRVVLDNDVEVAVFNINGAVYAVSNVCPHQHAPVLADGFIEDCTVMCPLHGWTYDLRTGIPVGGGARLKTYEIRVEGDDILMEEPKPEMPRWMR